MGSQNPSDIDDQHNCDATGRCGASGRAARAGQSALLLLLLADDGADNWNLSTNDWAGFATAQWQPSKLLVVFGGLRWEREQLPPPIAALLSTGSADDRKLPSLGNNWGPRISLALGSGDGHWPVLRLGYGMYFGRTENDTVETALTQTGSPNGDLNFSCGRRTTASSAPEARRRFLTC
jgi:hypothetical protein